MDAAQYRHEIAACLREAAERGLIDRQARVGSRGRLADLAEAVEAAYVVHVLTETPDYYQRRLWEHVAFLQPELGATITMLRRMQRVEDLIGLGSRHLASLRQRTRPAVRAGP
jgi:hypothetical protein